MSYLSLYCDRCHSWVHRIVFSLRVRIPLFFASGPKWILIARLFSLGQAGRRVLWVSQLLPGSHIFGGFQLLLLLTQSSLCYSFRANIYLGGATFLRVFEPSGCVKGWTFSNVSHSNFGVLKVRAFITRSQFSSVPLLQGYRWFYEL